MGRETKILLGLLGLLAGVFVGVLSMKLLVPRPPAGAGPDVHDEVAVATPADLVEPPALEPPVAGADRYAEAGSRFGTPADAAPTADPFVARSSVAPPQPLTVEAVGEALPIEQADAIAADDPPIAPSQPGRAIEPAGIEPAAYAPPSGAVGPSYVAADGDSWWSVAERAYGDGRFYRALYAWNRGLNPRVSLVPGTSLEVPPRSQLTTAWPALVPRE